MWPLQPGNQAQNWVAAALGPNNATIRRVTRGRSQCEQRLAMKIQLMADHRQPDRHTAHSSFGHYHTSEPLPDGNRFSRRRNSQCDHAASAPSISAAYVGMAAQPCAAQVPSRADFTPIISATTSTAGTCEAHEKSTNTDGAADGDLEDPGSGASPAFLRS
jgi:hypothetical protein